MTRQQRTTIAFCPILQCKVAYGYYMPHYLFFWRQRMNLALICKRHGPPICVLHLFETAGVHLG
jgi:hypothetical protein